MSAIISVEKEIEKTIRLVESNEKSIIRLNANGGNSVLIVCDPVKEIDYINAIRKLMLDNKFEIIDLNELLCEFVSKSKDELDERFDLLRGSIHQIFKIPAGEEGTDLFGLILQAIRSGFEANKIPVLINSGALYGSGIDNIHIMESELVMKSQLPIIILYPAVRDKDKLMFLVKRPASKYRCMIID